jgi:hypothetical protein
VDFRYAHPCLCAPTRYNKSIVVEIGSRRLTDSGTGVLRARQRLAKAGRIILGREWAGRDLTVLPDDTFLVSYPRSGSTWLRFLIGNLVHPDTPVTFANVESYVPYVDIHPDSVLLKAPRPRILETHEPFFPAYPRVIYIVRDPRDVAVSYHYILIKDRHLPDGFPMEEFLPLFLAGKDFGVRLGSWTDHVMSWVRMRQGTEGFLLVRYEDLLEDTPRELARLAEFLHVPPAPDRITHAVEMSSASRMRTLEKTEWRLWATTRRSRPDRPFVRSAKSGDWRSTLAVESVSAIESAWADAMRVLGYPPVTDGSGASVSPAGKATGAVGLRS